MAGLANNICDLKPPESAGRTYATTSDGLPERLAGVSLRRLNVLMDEAFNIALLLGDESFRD